MKGGLVLSGGGDIEDTFELDALYFALLKNPTPKILYIPVAMQADAVGYEACFDWFSKLVSAHAGTRELDFSMLLTDQAIPDLDEYDSVYFGGGNTFALLDYIKKTDFPEKIRRYIESGGLVYGGSAGAIILGKDIRTVQGENDKDYSEYLGLNMLSDYSIICHYQESKDSEITEASERLKIPIIALPENAGLLLSGDNSRVIGDVFVFHGGLKEKLRPEHLSTLVL